MSPLEAVSALAERSALLEAVSTAVIPVGSAVAALVDARVTGPAAVAGPVSGDRSHDAAAEDEPQQTRGDHLGGAVARETPRPARACRYRDRRGRCCRGRRR
ncbi:hypothetical protein, partial [Lentzea sp. CC55]|uniref:hypothetical protein n=1 Tax=Lentzea sp. CC55 TaxID=2884909 RepID=UPI001F18303F